METTALTEPTVMFIINKSWKPDFTDEDTYQAARGYWRMGERSRETAVVALAISHRVIRGAYRIEGWEPSPNEGEERRWGFIGHADESLQHLVGLHVSQVWGYRRAYNELQLYLTRSADGYLPGAAPRA